MPPAYVKPYVKTQKNDEADAEAICEAVTRPNMRFAEVKSVEQQSVLVLHRTRAMLIKHRTRMSNTIRAHLAEFGITETIGREGLSRLIDMIVSGEDDRITGVTRRAIICLVDQYRLLQEQILDLDRQVMAWHRSNEASKRLATIPGIGPLAASALVASVADASNFKNGRSFAAFIGLVPKQSSSGGKERLGGLDGLIGLIPGIGDVISGLISSYLIWEARRLGVSRWVMARMVGNAFLDTAVGAIPLAGDVFDVMFRANMKNMALLRQHLEKKGYANHTGPVIEGEAVRID